MFKSDPLLPINPNLLRTYIKRQDVEPISVNELVKNKRRIYAYLLDKSRIYSFVDKITRYGLIRIPLPEYSFRASLDIKASLKWKGKYYMIV